MTAATVSVSATAEREVDPDGFVVRIAVSGDGADAAAARDSLAASWAELESVVAMLGETVLVRRGQVRSWHDPRGKEREPGWLSERMMTLVSDDVRAAADVLGAAERLPEARVDGPMWQVHADNPAHAELQAAAVHEARARAERYAAALGTTLGRLVQLRDPGTGSGMWKAQAGAPARAAAYTASMDFAPEALRVSATVEATWELAGDG